MHDVADMIIGPGRAAALVFGADPERATTEILREFNAAICIKINEVAKDMPDGFHNAFHAMNSTIAAEISSNANDHIFRRAA